VAVLPDGRVISGGPDGRVLVWNPADPGTGPADLGHHNGGVDAAAALPDGRVASGGRDGRVLVWNPADPGAGPAELGRHDADVHAVTVLPDGRVISAGGDQRVRLWDAQSGGARSLLACSASALATSLSPSGAYLFISHGGGGISRWEVTRSAT
jgi:WD40 repeat protein